MLEKFDPLRYPSTYDARNLRFHCSCDDCSIDQLICSTKSEPPTAELMKSEQEERAKRRSIFAPREKNWFAATAHEISWLQTANVRAEWLLQADYKACAHIRQMIREHRDGQSMSAAGLPDVDALEKEWSEQKRSQWLAARYRRRAPRRRKKCSAPSF